eukprot:8446311-Karenia_brevis.AAC.1
MFFKNKKRIYGTDAYPVAPRKHARKHGSVATYTCKGCGTVYSYQQASEQNGMCDVSPACNGILLESDAESDEPKQMRPTSKAVAGPPDPFSYRAPPRRVPGRSVAPDPFTWRASPAAARSSEATD